MKNRVSLMIQSQIEKMDNRSATLKTSEHLAHGKTTYSREDVYSYFRRVVRSIFIAEFVLLYKSNHLEKHHAVENLCWKEETTAETLAQQIIVALAKHGIMTDNIAEHLVMALDFAYRTADRSINGDKLPNPHTLSEALEYTQNTVSMNTKNYRKETNTNRLN